MKLTLQIILLTLLQPVASSGILRGHAQSRELGSNSGGNTGGGGCPDKKTTLATSGLTACTTNAECASVCTNCCCINGGGFGRYCGVEFACTGFDRCIANSTPPPTPAPTDQNRGVGTPGGVVGGITVDANGCIATSQEWCPILNRCTVTATQPCSGVPVDADGCAVGHPDGPEIFCDSRNDCILDQLWSCPMTNPAALCPGKIIAPVTLIDHMGNGYTPKNGNVHYYPANAATQVRARVVEGFDGPFVGEVDFTLLNDEYQLFAGSVCAGFYNIIVYFTTSLRHPFHVCWEEMIEGANQVPPPFGQYGIPRCANPQGDTQSVMEWYRLTLSVSGPSN